MANRLYTRGLHQIGPHSYAYLQPNGSWGLANSGLVIDGGEALLVDTLFTPAMTEEMLGAITAQLPGVEITTVVNTHDDGDHVFGNQLFADATIISSAATAEHMRTAPSVAYFRDLIERARAGKQGVLGDYIRHHLGSFDLSGIESTPANVTFSGRRDVTVGRHRVRLTQVGPAHTDGDVLVEAVDDGVLFTGDILFVGSHPIIHSGPVHHWIEACELIGGLNIDTIVPGHGPVVAKPYVNRFRAYLEHVADHASRSLKAGLSVTEAAAAFPMTDYANWSDADRIVLNVAAVYRELGAQEGDFTSILTKAAELWAAAR